MQTSPQEYAPNIDWILQDYAVPEDANLWRAAYESLVQSPELQAVYLRLLHGWVLYEQAPDRGDHFRFLDAHHAPAAHKSGGAGSRGGAQSYTCLWPGCGKELKSRADRAQEHVLEHWHIKPFKCEHCKSTTFLRKNDCSRHEKTCQKSSAAKNAPRGARLRKQGGRGSAPYPPAGSRPGSGARTTTTPNASRSATESPLSPTNLLQMTMLSPMHLTSPLSPSPISPQQLYGQDVVPSTSPTNARYADAQLQSSSLRAGYVIPSQSAAAASSSSMPPVAPTLLFPSMPTPVMPSSPHHPYLPLFDTFAVQGSMPPVPYQYRAANGSNDSFMPSQGNMGPHQPFPPM